jgi:probable F420-dependent oxidoreductase
MSEQRPFRFAAQAFSADSARQWRGIVREAEALGYSTLHVADHYFGPGPLEAITNHPVQKLAAVPALAMAAEATERIRIGSRLFCVDYHLPAVLAKEAATLDMLSDGRLELGLGAGWLAAEYEAIGIDHDPLGVRIRRLAEVIELVRAHFSGEPIDVRGEFVSVCGYSGVPVPVQSPPPIMVGGGGKNILTLAGRTADIVSLNLNNRAGVLGPDGVRTTTAEETARKVGYIRDAAAERGRGMPELEVATYFTFITDDGKAVAEQLGAEMGLSPEEMRSHPLALIGTVDDICDQLEERRETFGISYVTILVDAIIPGTATIRDFAPVVERMSGR